MGRKRTPIEGSDPVARFAAKLQEQLARDPSLTYREIAKLTKWGRSTIAAAVGGKRLPTWPVTEDILKCCGATPAELSTWKAYWEVLSQALRARRRPGESGEDGEDDDEEEGYPRPRELAVGGTRDWRPRPDLVETFGDLAHELRRLKVAAGNPPLRDLAPEVNFHSFHVRTNKVTASVTTLSDIFTGRRRPNASLFQAIVIALRNRSTVTFESEEQQRPWQSDQAWAEAWTRAEFNRVLAGESPPRTRSMHGVVLPSARDGDRSAIGNLAIAKPRVAAEMLVDMHPRVVSEIIAALPEPAKTRMLTAVLEQHWGTRKMAKSGFVAPGPVRRAP
ncbi:helix-turn-helix transcriptional regulator [Nocardia sp. BMG51109]|uniref:helix-turn-helix domain-containing protein n=1 Tax=Nocardia sp. BMG51109 TaxID=1056816 RepID=UPI0004B5DD34|nr:helix-turn-helix transcriptional regulator [Nocardia sp. BMG51109]